MVAPTDGGARKSSHSSSIVLAGFGQLREPDPLGIREAGTDTEMVSPESLNVITSHLANRGTTRTLHRTTSASARGIAPGESLQGAKSAALVMTTSNPP